MTLRGILKRNKINFNEKNLWLKNRRFFSFDYLEDLSDSSISFSSVIPLKN